MGVFLEEKKRVCLFAFAAGETSGGTGGDCNSNMTFSLFLNTIFAASLHSNSFSNNRFPGRSGFQAKSISSEMIYLPDSFDLTKHVNLIKTLANAAKLIS